MSRQGRAKVIRSKERLTLADPKPPRQRGTQRERTALPPHPLGGIPKKDESDG